MCNIELINKICLYKKKKNKQKKQKQNYMHYSLWKMRLPFRQWFVI